MIFHTLLAHLRETYLSAHPLARKEARSLAELKSTLDQIPISHLGLSNRARRRLLWAMLGIPLKDDDLIFKEVVKNDY